eukprot:TRINITY_DN80531_c0_g1_i1.p1 TRINITY_DN80531_c0_g1~~TRINITY_DN80531_c0_g1_i1.p1  ORF type:complete len:422 (-),score=99.62 TRINITY_DN80531_c0_g1_i1:265-1530(-)
MQLRISALILLLVASATSAEKIHHASHLSAGAVRTKQLRQPGGEEDPYTPPAAPAAPAAPAPAAPAAPLDTVDHYVPDEAVKKAAKSAIPDEVQYLIACAWIGLIGAIPLILEKYGNKETTQTHHYLSVALWVTLFGGVYLFTQIILFSSPKFGDEVRPLTIIECIYFMSQVITTVGYGDITPAKPRGQVFVGLYVLGALLVISMFVSNLIEIIQKVAAEYQESLNAQPVSRVSETGSVMDELNFISCKPKEPDTKPLIRSFQVFLVIDVLWIFFFHNFPGEDKTLMEAIYMSVITLSTVGFGAFTPNTEEGMIFAAFFMLFGSAALVNVIGNFAELMIQCQIYEQFDPKQGEKALDQLEERVSGSKVSELDWIRFGLTSQGLVDESEVDKLLQAFQEFGPRKGVIDLKDVKAVVQQSKKQ